MFHLKESEKETNRKQSCHYIFKSERKINGSVMMSFHRTHTEWAVLFGFVSFTIASDWCQIYRKSLNLEPDSHHVLVMFPKTMISELSLHSTVRWSVKQLASADESKKHIWFVFETIFWSVHMMRFIREDYEVACDVYNPSHLLDNWFIKPFMFVNREITIKAFIKLLFV